jgi:YVTN family beta-propeller protein
MALHSTSPTRERGIRRSIPCAQYPVLSAQYPVFVLIAFAGLCCLLSSRADDSSPKTAPPISLRRPVALALADDGKWLFVANRDSGSISVIDPAEARAVAEVPAGRKLADLAITPDGRRVLAVDEDAGELLVFVRDGSKLQAPQRVKVSPAPVSVRIAPDGTRCTVASLWSWRLSVFTLDKTPGVVTTIDLSFAPREQLWLPDGKRLLVADAFAGRLAVVDMEQGIVESVRTLPAHNIRGLALSADGKRLLLAHQILHPMGTASRDDIHWGNLLTNNLRSLLLANVLNPKADFLTGSELSYFGEAGHGTADPAGVAVTSAGKVLVPLAGVAELAYGDARGWRYAKVGARPTAVVASPDGQRAYVANTSGDSISIVNLKDDAVAEIPLGARRNPTAAERGEVLFHDARLAHDGWLSCHSCHTDGHSNSLLADTLGDGTYGTPKRVLSLRGVGDTGPWAWNGSMATLEAQVRKSIETTMHGKKPTDDQVSDLTAYLKTLPPPPSLDRLRGRVDDEAVKRGREVFAEQACANCHAPPTYTSGKTYDVGLADEQGLKHFNPPSLRGISQGGPYFHDGRAATLADVFAKHRHQLKGDLAKTDLDDLLSFLNSL